MELSEIGEKVFEVEAIVKQRVRKVTRVPMFFDRFLSPCVCANWVSYKLQNSHL